VLLAIDVQYTENTAFVAGICFEDWRSSQPCGEYVSVVCEVAEYQPGFFYRRELPCILKLIEEHDLRPTTIVIDGYVFLDGTEKPGLGKHLHEALNQSVTVIGVAKKAFSGIPEAHALLRGKSQKPLYKPRRCHAEYRHHAGRTSHPCSTEASRPAVPGSGQGSRGLNPSVMHTLFCSNRRRLGFLL